MPLLTENLIKEELSISYTNIVAARNGFAFTIEGRDSDSIDGLLRYDGKLDDHSKFSNASVGVQLKATINWEKSGNIIKYSLKAKNYNQLVDEECMFPKILVLLCLPKDKNDWTDITKDRMLLRNCAYWVSLKGLDATTNTSNIVVDIPEDQLLNEDEMKRLMIKAQKQDL